MISDQGKLRKQLARSKKIVDVMKQMSMHYKPPRKKLHHASVDGKDTNLAISLSFPSIRNSHGGSSIQPKSKKSTVVAPAFDAELDQHLFPANYNSDDVDYAHRNSTSPYSRSDRNSTEDNVGKFIILSSTMITFREATSFVSTKDCQVEQVVKKTKIETKDIKKKKKEPCSSDNTSFDSDDSSSDDELPKKKGQSLKIDSF
ncbi:hypothetical protein ACFE04_003748 [Oxalis oulophora]